MNEKKIENSKNYSERVREKLVKEASKKVTKKRTSKWRALRGENLRIRKTGENGFTTLICHLFSVIA